MHNPPERQPSHHYFSSKRQKVRKDFHELRSEVTKKSLELKNRNLELQLVKTNIEIEEGNRKLSSLKSQPGSVQVGGASEQGAAVGGATVSSMPNRGVAAPSTLAATAAHESDDEDLFSTASNEDLTSHAKDPVDINVNEDYKPNSTESECIKSKTSQQSETSSSKHKRKSKEKLQEEQWNAYNGAVSKLASNQNNPTKLTKAECKAILIIQFEQKVSHTDSVKQLRNQLADKLKTSNATGVKTNYSEKSLMSRYAPTIIDHSILDHPVGHKKFLVRWDKIDSPFTTESSCTSWLDFKGFIFPGLAKDYFSNLAEGKTLEKSTLKDWAYTFEGIEANEKLSNEFELEESEIGRRDLAEVDFCCFTCKCNDTATDLNTKVRNCDESGKHHRMCCHGYKKYDNVDGFISKAGQALMMYWGDEDKPQESEADKSIDTSDANAAKPTAIQFHIGKSIPVVEKRQHPGVVLGINTGVGSLSIALKRLNIVTKTILYVEEDPVTRDIIRYHHDFRYGETNHDDGINHIVGLYDNLNELMVDPAVVIQRFGPIGT